MKTTIEAINKGKNIRVVGFDDAPFEKQRGGAVNLSGIICSGTRFEGMLWGEVVKDGNNATQTLIDMVTASKFHSQLHAVLIDGIAFGGFNIIDLPTLSKAISLPCIAVMRKKPDLTAIHNALENLEDHEKRKELIDAAGLIHEVDNFVFQVIGLEPKIAADLLARVTDTGKVPEALRLAHLIGAAIKTGESSNRA